MKHSPRIPLKKMAAMLLICLVSQTAKAQVGDYRSELAFGVSGGYMLSNVGFNPEIPQQNLGGITAGVTLRYTCEKYFKSICAIVAELNFAQTGWKEELLTADDLPVINPATGQAEAYQRELS